MSSLPSISIISHKADHASLRLSSNINSLPPLSVGEIVEAEIVRNLTDTTVLVELKGNRIEAYSPVGRRSGERITVRVDQVRPSIVLRLMNQQASTATAAADHHIVTYRSNPAALVDSLLNLGRIFSGNNPGELFHHIGAENVKTIQTMLSSLILSGSTSGSDFFKNFLLTLGFFMENQLGDACRKRFGKMKAIRGATNNIKGLLTRIIDKIQAINKHDGHPGMERLIWASESSIKAIESLQIMNAALHEQEQKFLFQIPIAFPDGTGMAEIFMKYDDNSKQNRGHKKIWTLHCLLSMDALGEITVEARIEESRVRCKIYCGDESVRTFIQHHVDEIRKRMSTLGYDIASVGCFVRTETGTTREQWVSLPNLEDHDSVNVVV